MSVLTDSAQLQCPYCGESIDLLVARSIERQNYIEDCAVCCRPIELSVTVLKDEISVDAKRDDE